MELRLVEDIEWLNGDIDSFHSFHLAEGKSAIADKSNKILIYSLISFLPIVIQDQAHLRGILFVYLFIFMPVDERVAG